MGIREVMEDFRKRHPTPMGVAPLMARGGHSKGEKEPESPMTANETLYDLVLGKGLSISEFAAKVAVVPSVAWQWIHKGRVPRPWIRLRVSRFLGVPVEQLWPDTKATISTPNFGYIEGLLHAKGHSLAASASAMEVNRGVLYEICRGHVARPHSMTLQRIAAFLDMTVEELISRRPQ